MLLSAMSRNLGSIERPFVPSPVIVVETMLDMGACCTAPSLTLRPTIRPSAPSNNDRLPSPGTPFFSTSIFPPRGCDLLTAGIQVVHVADAGYIAFQRPYQRPRSLTRTTSEVCVPRRHASVRPSGDHAKSKSRPDRKSVSCRGEPPSSGCTHTLPIPALVAA
jgi:hypothetical protein